MASAGSSLSRWLGMADNFSLAVNNMHQKLHQNLSMVTTFGPVVCMQGVSANQNLSGPKADVVLFCVSLLTVISVCLSLLFSILFIYIFPFLFCCFYFFSCSFLIFFCFSLGFLLVILFQAQRPCQNMEQSWRQYHNKTPPRLPVIFHLVMVLSKPNWSAHVWMLHLTIIFNSSHVPSKATQNLKATLFKSDPGVFCRSCFFG